ALHACAAWCLLGHCHRPDSGETEERLKGLPGIGRAGICPPVSFAYGGYQSGKAVGLHRYRRNLGGCDIFTRQPSMPGRDICQAAGLAGVLPRLAKAHAAGVAVAPPPVSTWRNVIRPRIVTPI